MELDVAWALAQEALSKSRARVAKRLAVFMILFVVGILLGAAKPLESGRLLTRVGGGLFAGLRTSTCRLDVVNEQTVLVAQEKLPVRDRGIGPA